MGCAQSSEASAQGQPAGATKNGQPQQQLAPALTRQMTVGEAMDAKLVRGATVQHRLEDAKAELDANRSKCGQGASRIRG